jgi:hypothetical protein
MRRKTSPYYIIQKHGAEGIWIYLTGKPGGFISAAEKPGISVPASPND